MITKGDKVKTLVEKRFVRDQLRNILEAESVLTVLEVNGENLTLDISEYFPYLNDKTLVVSIADVEKTYIKKEDKRIRCPVCGKHVFTMPSDYDICPICWWENDGNITDLDEYTTTGETLREAIDNYKQKLLNEKRGK